MFNAIDLPTCSIVCLKCKKEHPLSFLAMNWETVVWCSCNEPIRTASQYNRSKLEPIAERLGIKEFRSIHEPVTEDEEEELLSCCTEEEIGNG